MREGVASSHKPLLHISIAVLSHSIVFMVDDCIRATLRKSKQELTET